MKLQIKVLLSTSFVRDGDESENESYARIADHESYIHNVFWRTEWYVQLSDAQNIPARWELGETQEDRTRTDANPSVKDGKSGLHSLCTGPGNKKDTLYQLVKCEYIVFYCSRCSDLLSS